MNSLAHQHEVARSRKWVFTLNNFSEQDKVILRNESIHDPRVRWVNWGEEIAPSTGTPHLQGAIWFKNPLSRASVRKFLPNGCWFEAARGTAEQCKTYCSKGGHNIFEHGECPIEKRRNGEMERDRYQDAWDAAKEGRLDDIPADIRIRNYGTLQRIRMNEGEKPTSIDGELQNEWYVGKPGTGKSRTARENYPDNYNKPLNKWWDGYKGEDYVILDDVDLSCAKYMGTHLKLWADRYPFTAEIKGSAISIRPKKIIVTSNYTIEEIFKGDYPLIEAIERRFKIINFN